MATVSGTRTTTPQGPINITAPGGNVNIQTTNTNFTGNANIGGNLNVSGGSVTISGISTFSNQVTITSTVSSTSTTTGALVVRGGVGIGENLNVGGNGAFTGTVIIYNSATITGTITVVGNSSTVIIKANDNNVGNPLGVAYTNTNIYGTFNQRQQGAVYVGGGVGIEKDLNVGGFIYGRIAQAQTSTDVVVTSTNLDQLFYPIFAKYPYAAGSTETSFSSNYIDNVSSGTTTSTGGLTYNPFTGQLNVDRVYVASTASATSSTNAAFTVSGGAGIVGDVYIGGAEYVDNLYTKIISSTKGPIDIKPESSMVDIFGDIRVRGEKPIGTAPVVTNVLYVTMDGDDTNDGRAQDASRACRTVGGAINSPYYQPGTQIRVSPGHYFEDNPLVMKPYTSVMGSDIRTTEIEPINRTQDLFHVNSGCYLAFMQFCQGRSGLLPGNYYTNGTNRGAYATAFPPQTGDNRIDLFHSPYIQNCTNLSGPWLKDGSLFQPNGTVQVPLAVAESTWNANTTTLIVTLNSMSTGTIKQGMYVNQGQQNPGFFNARTLLLANKPFMQAQVVSYVEQTFNSGSFVYNKASCYRDTGLIIDSIAIDLLYDSNSDSTFSGLQYWNQDVGFTGIIDQQITTTTNAIIFAGDLITGIASSFDVNAGNLVSDNINLILNILNSGPSGISDSVVSNGLPSVTTSTVNAYNAIIAARDNIALQTINYINANNPTFEYNTSTCYRDVGFIINSVAFDLLHGGNKQSIKSGVYYFGYDSTSSAVSSQIPQVTAAYNYIKSIIPSIVTGQKLTTQYSTSTQVTTGYPAATSYEIAALQAKIDIITNIVRNGPSVAEPQTPIGLVKDQNIVVLNAFNLLAANRSFIQAEVIAYVDSQFNTFTYNQQLCYRDVGIIVENVTYDAVFGGNEKSVEAGLAYFRGVTSLIAGQESQTVAALDYLRSLCKKVISNTTATVLLPVYNIPQANQVRNTVLTGGEVILTSIDPLFDIITTIISNGPSTAPTRQNTPGPDAAYLSAEVLLQANRKFIQEDTINWINNTFKKFPYSTVKCQRDIGVVLDSTLGDVLFPTDTFSQSTFAGLQYYSQGNLVGEIPSEINQTIDAFTYLRDLSIKIVQNITPDDDLVARYQTTELQVTNLEAATSEETATIVKLFDYILTILKGNILGWTDLLKFGFSKSQYLSAQNAYDLLEANKEYFKEEVVAYINAVNPGFSSTYDQALCKRDIGIIIDSIAFDLLYGGNKQSIQAGLSYYGFSETTSIRQQEIETTDAFTYMSTIVGEIIQNIPVVNLQTKVKQVTTILPPSDAVTAALFAQSFSTITNIITNGPGIAAVSPISLVPTTSTFALNAIAILEANRDFIKAELIRYIDNTYNSGSYSYDAANCYRDTGLIIDGIAIDMLYNSTSDSVFAGLQYWNQDGYTGKILSQLTETVGAINYASVLSAGIISTYTNEVNTITGLFGEIVDIIQNGTTGITDLIVSNGLPSTTATIVAAYNLLQSNKSSIQQDTVDYVIATYPSLVFNSGTCYRDVGHIIDSVSFDLLHTGNKQSIKSGVYYYSYDIGTTQIPGQVEEVTAAYSFIENLVRYIVKAEATPRVFQTSTVQITILPAATDDEVATLQSNLNIITNIINNGPSVAGTRTPIGLIKNTNTNVLNAYNLLEANRTFIQEEVIAFINGTYVDRSQSFSYNEASCYRDTGLIVDAVSQDVLLGGNQKSIEAGLAYWNQGYNYVTGQESTTTMAINHARDLALQIISNEAAIPQLQTETKQVINPFYQYGGDYMPAQSVRRSFNIITDLIERGPLYTPILYPGSGLVNSTGLNALDVLIAPRVTSVRSLGGSNYLIGLNTSTVGFAKNATLYFGDISIFPKQDFEVDAIAVQYTGNATTWDMRKVDDIGGMGGSLVDGAVISDRSPINSFVYDAFTQLTQGGRGVRITNNGYAQLVSVFTIFSSVGVQVDNGGIASIVNSNANFGDLCLVAKGYGTRKFSGTVYNPAFKAYPSGTYLDQYYPNGFWPNGAQVQIFCPDVADRPHISLVMEVVAPNEQTNEQGLPGFLNSQPSIATLTPGSITITGLDNTGIAIGNSVYIRDQFGYPYDNFPYVYNQLGEYLDITGKATTDPTKYITNPSYGVYYGATGTVVTDLGYQSVTLNYALPGGGGFADNSNYFTLYFTGNSYYTVLSSTIANNPRVTGTNILSTFNSNVVTDQVQAHIDSLEFLNELVNNIIGNTPVISLQTTATFTPTISQTFLPTVTGGANASEFIDLRFSDLVKVLGATSSTFASIIPPNLVKKTGSIVSGAGSAVTLIEANKAFMTNEITAFVNVQANTSTFIYDQTTCARDLGFVLEGTYYDVALGTNYNAVTSGLSYRRGTSYSVTATELVQTIRAFDFAQQQSAQALASNATAVRRSTRGFDEIKNILANGTGVASAITYPAPTNTATTVINSVTQLTTNKEFIKAEILAWLATNYSGVIFDSAACSRDVGYIIDAICYDIMYGGNSASCISADAYFVDGIIVIGAGEYSATSAAYGYLSTIAQEIILGQPVSVTAGNNLTQTNNGLLGSVTQADIINANLAIIQTAIATQTPRSAVKVYPDVSWINAGIKAADDYLASQQATIIDETLAYIDTTFAGTFTYDEAKCYRDTGLIVDALMQDLLFGGTSQSTFAGIQYWNQGTYVGDIANELTTTTSAINYISQLSQLIVQNDTGGTRYQSTVTQVTNLPAATGAESTIIAADFSVITDILTNGIAGITDIIVPNSIAASGNIDVLHAFDLLQANREYLQAEAIAYVESTKTPGFIYDQTKCARDVGYMIDSVSVDLLYGGNRQAIQSGVYYYAYNDTSSAIPNEIPQTTAAYNHIRSIISDIILGGQITFPYQDLVAQVTNLSPGSSTEVSAVQSRVDLITGIINNGPVGVTKTSINPVASTDPTTLYAVSMLNANRAFIQAEVIAYINEVLAVPFTYDVKKCRRDTELILQRLIYDLQSGGNYNMVQNGLSYWARNGTHHIVQLGENVTRNDLFPDGATVNFYQRSYISASGYVFEYVGAGTNYGALPQFGVADPVQGKEVVQLDAGKVFFTSTDQNGDFRIGPGLVISQATGVLSGRTFTKSLFANMTPFILAIEGGGAF